MVSSKLLSILSCGIFALQVYAGPLPGFEQVTPLKPLREDELNSVQKRAVVQSMDDAMKLMPIREDDLTPSHLRRRANDLSRLDLLDSVKMMYGGMASPEQMYLANMTLYAPKPEHPLIMMEKFDGLTVSADCDDKDNKISMTFKTKEAMDYAIYAWDWVNENADDCFYLIANAASCGPEDQRYPYRIIDVDYDEEHFTATLTSQAVTWEDIAGHFDIDLGRANIPPTAQKLAKRGFWDIFPKLDFSKSVSWDISTDTKGRHNLYTDPFHESPMVSVDCVDCFLAGSIEFTGHIVVQGFDIKELYFSAAPKDVEARLELEVHILAGIPQPGLDLKQTLFELGIPGLSIPAIFTLGPSLEYQVGFQIAMYGIANFSVGVDVKLPNEAALIGDLIHSENSGAKGFEATTVDPILDLHDLSVTVNAAVYAQPVLAFGIKVLDKWGFEAALTLKLPYINADLTVGYKEDGLCMNDDQKIKTGVTAKSGAAIELWFSAGTVDGSSFIPNYNNKLWGYRWPFYDVCFPFHIPGLEDGEPDQATTTVPVTGASDFTSIAITEANEMPTMSITNFQGPPTDVPANPTTAPAVTDAVPTTTALPTFGNDTIPGGPRPVPAPIDDEPKDVSSSIEVYPSTDAEEYPSTTSVDTYLTTTEAGSYPLTTDESYPTTTEESYPTATTTNESYPETTGTETYATTTVDATYVSSAPNVTGSSSTPCTKGIKPATTVTTSTKSSCTKGVKPATTSYLPSLPTFTPSPGYKADHRRARRQIRRKF